MTNRYTPFGYGVEHGAVITIQEEVVELRGIFQSYVSGKSLKKIAEELAERKVPYLPGKCQWNKNRVARLLCDSRYVGADAFPAVISQEEFQHAQAVRGQNSTQKNCVHERVISEAAVPILCGCCGSPAMRRQDRRTAYKQKWVCTNRQCGKHYLITDERLNHMIKELLTQADIETLDSAPANSSELNRLENEIARLMEQAQPDGEALRTMILETAAKKYEAASHGRHITDRLRTDLQKANLSDFITRQQIMSIAKQITLLSDDAIQITLMNDQVIERGEHSGE